MTFMAGTGSYDIFRVIQLKCEENQRIEGLYGTRSAGISRICPVANSRWLINI